MDKYQVVGLLGEGSFGRVYKAKEVSSNKLVALKVICKRGKCCKELKALRRECEIQRHLHHPNIIQMLDSFETDNEIVVITEFAHKELNALLGKKGVLPEETVQKIVWDLVSALYYLHSHRVLHRDLKPQNILLDTNNKAKLCDFGFARNMSTGTHVLTSIKGTPLYMAPELVEEQPYDHNADLWSLGCIIYELLEGAPPFRTTSILHLIRLIRTEQIQWPTMVSEHCISFLKGLLQKNPQKRLTWPEILNHPYVKGHLTILEDSPEMPLTRPLSVNTLEAKEQQRREHTNRKLANQDSVRPKKPDDVDMKEESVVNDLKKLSFNKDNNDDKKHSKESENDSELDKADNQDVKNNNQPIDKSEGHQTKETDKELAMSVDQASSDSKSKNLCEAADSTNKKEKIVDGRKIIFVEHSYKIENEEWFAFLKKTAGELISGDLTPFTQASMLDIIMSPLLNSTASSNVVCLVAKLFCLPFAKKESDRSSLNSLKSLYLKINLVPNLLYAAHLIMRPRKEDLSNPDQESKEIRNFADLSSEDFNALEYIFLAINHFIHWNEQYVEQFCDAIVTIKAYSKLKLFLLCTKKKLRLVIDLMACLAQILRVFPQRHGIVDKVLLQELHGPNLKSFSLVDLLRHENTLLRERTCYFIILLGKSSPDCMEVLWNETAKETLEALMYDSIDTVRIAAERAYEGLKDKHFYSKEV